MPKGLRNVPIVWACVDCGLEKTHYQAGRVPRRCKPCRRKGKTARVRERREQIRLINDGMYCGNSFDYRMKGYGLDPRKVEALMRHHGPKCMACGTVGEFKMNGIFVDHCHETRTFRGFLCNPCNAALGLLKDSPERIEGLLMYMRTRPVVTE